MPLVVYAILTEQNIAKLFAAAMVPGLHRDAAATCIVIAIYCRVRPELAHAERAAAVARALATRWLGIWPIVTIFVVVFGGIYGGVFSPTEGAAVGALAHLRRRPGAARTALAGMRSALPRHGRDAGDGVHDLPRRRHDEFGAGADADAGRGWPTGSAHLHGAAAGRSSAACCCFYVVLGCVMDELSMLLLTIPVIFPADHGPRLWGLAPEHKAIWFGILVLMTRRHRPDRAAGGAERLRRQQHREGRADEPRPIAWCFLFLAWDVVRTTLLLFFPPLALWAVKFVR